MMKSILLLILTLVISCNLRMSKKMNVEQVYAKLYLDWIYAMEISDFNFSEEIKRPVGVQIFLFKIKFLKEGGQSTKEHCVYYRVPFKKISGVLTVIENKENEKCSEVPLDSALYEIENINNLRVSFKSFELKLDFLVEGKKTNFSFPLLNIVTGVSHTKLMGEQFTSKVSGLSLMRTSKIEKDFIYNNYIGKKSDRFSLDTAIKCRKIDSNCSLVGEDVCDRCKYGSFSVVNGKCTFKGIRYCGINHCGEKNEPACSRGIKVLDSEDDGICSNDLRPTFNQEHILVCQ